MGNDSFVEIPPVAPPEAPAAIDSPSPFVIR